MKSIVSTFNLKQKQKFGKGDAFAFQKATVRFIFEPTDSKTPQCRKIYFGYMYYTFDTQGEIHTPSLKNNQVVMQLIICMFQCCNLALKAQNFITQLYTYLFTNIFQYTYYKKIEK